MFCNLVTSLTSEAKQSVLSSKNHSTVRHLLHKNLKGLTKTFKLDIDLLYEEISIKS